MASYTKGLISYLFLHIQSNKILIVYLIFLGLYIIN